MHQNEFILPLREKTLTHEREPHAHSEYPLFAQSSWTIQKSTHRQVKKVSHLTKMDCDFRICDCEFMIELRTIGIQKGAFTSLWAANKYYDFIMAIGDGQTDEDLFKILDKNAYTIKVGRSNNSQAVYHLASQSDVLPFLQRILDFGLKEKKTTLRGIFELEAPTK